VTATGATVHLTISTTSGGSAALRKLFGNRFMAFWSFFGGILFVGSLGRTRTRNRKWVGVIVLVILLASLVACSASSNKSGSGNGDNSAPSASSTTPANNYAVVVRATSGNKQSATIVNLTVQ
jgi:peptidoglycan/LPS O-acetylase OafA/YrhL